MSYDIDPANSEAAPINASAAGLAPDDRLCVPHRKRLSHEYVLNDDGVRELRIYYGLKDVTFDEPRLFAFGERLVAAASFTGRDAMAWGPDYAWDDVGPLLAALLADGILVRGDGSSDPRGGGLVESPLPPSVCPVAQTWSQATCESITRELGGRAVELGYLEAVIPVYRIAHPALDADDRQVGEANVFPRALRLDRETEWRVCQYPGSRYRDEMPMNVTALKAMVKHWKPIMKVISQIAAELRRRLGPGHVQWTIGELHVLSSVVLALPAFALVRRGGRSPQPPLHPILSSLFRITDGIRMATQSMLLEIESNRAPDEPMTAATMFGYLEQRSTLIGETGVCAGPNHLIHEFLAAVIDGDPVDGIADLELPGEVEALVAELPAAVDYGLYGMQAWATSTAIWLAMSRAYEAVLAELDHLADSEGGVRGPLRDRLRADWRVLERLQITRDFDREVHLKTYRDGYEQSWRASRLRIGQPQLAQQLAPRPETPLHVAVASQLRAILYDRLASRALPRPGGAPAIDLIVDALVRYLRDEQAVLVATTETQSAINALLERPRPTRLLGVRDLAVNYALSSGPGVFPYLFDSLEQELGVRVECAAHAIKVIDLQAEPTPFPMCCASISAGGQ